MQMTTLLLKHVASSARGHPRRGPTCRLVPLANSPSGREVAQAPGAAVTLGRPLRPHLKAVPYIILFAVDVSLSFSLSVCLSLSPSPSLVPSPSFSLSLEVTSLSNPGPGPADASRGTMVAIRSLRARKRTSWRRQGAWTDGHLSSELRSAPHPATPTESHTEPSARRGRPAARPKATNSSKGISPPRRSVCCCLMNKSQANQTSLFHLWVWFGGG